MGRDYKAYYTSDNQYFYNGIIAHIIRSNSVHIVTQQYKPTYTHG